MVPLVVFGEGQVYAQYMSFMACSASVGIFTGNHTY